MTVLGILSEGPTDAIVIEAFIAAHLPDATLFRLHPEVDESGIMQSSPNGTGYGWRGVQTFCETISDDLDTFLATVRDQPLDALIVHVDSSMAHNVSAARPCPPAMATATALSTVIRVNWLNVPAPRKDIIVVTPSKETEAWVVAGLGLPRTSAMDIECDWSIAMELVRARKLKMKNGQPKKSQLAYIDMAPAITTGAAEIIKQCTTAAAFVHDLGQL